MKMRAKGLFDESQRMERLTPLGDTLERINRSVDWESFRPLIQGAFTVKESGKSGRPAYDKLLLFKILILQAYYGLSDHGVEYQLTDRRSFMRFVGLGVEDKVPDSNPSR